MWQPILAIAVAALRVPTLTVPTTQPLITTAVTTAIATAFVTTVTTARVKKQLQVY